MTGFTETESQGYYAGPLSSSKALIQAETEAPVSRESSQEAEEQVRQSESEPLEKSVLRNKKELSEKPEANAAGSASLMLLPAEPSMIEKKTSPVAGHP